MGARCSKSCSGDGEAADGDCQHNESDNLHGDSTNCESKHLHGAGMDPHEGNGRMCEKSSSGAGGNGKSTDVEGKRSESENFHDECRDDSNSLHSVVRRHGNLENAR